MFEFDSSGGWCFFGMMIGIDAFAFFFIVADYLMRMYAIRGKGDHLVCSVGGAMFLLSALGYLFFYVAICWAPKISENLW
jgi:hypothetical protein